MIFTDMASWAAKYMSPIANWHNAALYFGIPTISGVDFAAGLEFVFGILGKSWLRTPELTQAYQDFVNAPTVDVQKIRAVTDMITENASMIPVNGSFVQITVRSQTLLHLSWKGAANCCSMPKIGGS